MLHSIEQRIVEKFGKEKQTIIAMEEMAELTKELSKNLRGADNRMQILEEMADVEICMSEIRLMHGIQLNELAATMDEKLKRTEEREL